MKTSFLVGRSLSIISILAANVVFTDQGVLAFENTYYYRWFLALLLLSYAF